MRSATRPAPTCAPSRSPAPRCCAHSPRRRNGRVELLRPSSLDELDGASNTVLLAGGTEVVPLLREGLLRAETLVDINALVPHGIDGTRIGAGATLAELEVDPQVPDALREACRLAASPQLRNMGSIAGNLLQATRCWYWRLDYPCRLHGDDRRARRRRAGAVAPRRLARRRDAAAGDGVQGAGCNGARRAGARCRGVVRRLLLLGLVCLLAACGGKGGGSTSAQLQTNASGCVSTSAPSANARTGSKPT